MIPTFEMFNYFYTRTNKHIQLVQKHANIIENKFPNLFKGLYNQSLSHDSTKFTNPELIPYVLLTWKKKCDKEQIEFIIDNNLITFATEHHVKNNRHHPEFHTSQINVINPNNRDEPTKHIINATSMLNVDIGEMIADWAAVSEELKTNIQDWKNKNVGIRWKFTPYHIDIIQQVIDTIYK
jgi:hypothetical protein